MRCCVELLNKIQFPVCFHCKELQQKHIHTHMTCIDNDEEKVVVYVIKMHKHIYEVSR